MNGPTNEFQRIESLFREVFERESNRINSDFEDIISNVYVYPPKSQQIPISFCIGIDVLFQNVTGNNSDNLSLELYFEEQQTFEMNASISWGYPTGERVAWMFNKALEVTDENLMLVQNQLPEMINILRQSIENNSQGK